MAVTNRALDTSEQKKTFSAVAAATATGTSGVVGLIPFPCALNCIQAAAFGNSGSPTVAVVVNRFIVGSGATAITIATGTSNVMPSFGTSGLPTSGLVTSASFAFLPGDLVDWVLGGTTSAVTGLAITLVVDPIQDVKTFFGTLA